MSYQATQWALKHAPEMTPSARNVLACMAESADEDGRNCYESQATIAAYLYCDVRTVQRVVKSLRDMGLIRPGDSARVAHIPAHVRPSIWDLNMAVVRPDSETPSALRQARLETGRAKKALSNDAKTTPPDISPPPVICHPPTNNASPPDISSLTPRHLMPDPPTPVSDKPSYEPPREPSLEPPAQIRDDSVGCFDDFWDVYPRKAKRDAAEEAFARAAVKAGAQTVIAGAVRYAEDPNLPQMRYIPLPFNWLDDGRWKDAPEPSRMDVIASKPSTTDQRVNSIWDIDTSDISDDYDPAKIQPPTYLESRRRKAISA